MKISIHGHSLPILGILFTLYTHPFFADAGRPINENLRGMIDDGEEAEPLNAEVLRGMVRKIPIDLDLSGDVPRGILLIPHDLLRYKTYFVEGQHYNTHRIGDVSDGDYLLPDERRNIERNVYFCIEEDGRRVLKIADLFMTEDGLRREITEMMKLPGEPLYEELRRIPLDIDILEEYPHQVGIHRQSDSGVVTYAIQRKFRDRFIIGVVKYAGLVVDDRLNENVLKREAILYMHKVVPQILVTSHMKDGSKINARYLFGKERNGGVIVPMRTEVARPR